MYVVECKINADLAAIQNPTTKAFASPAGYGRLFQDNQGGKDSLLRFIVFGFPKNLDLSKVDSRFRVRVHARTWDHLAAAFPANPLSTDLALSLGVLGIGAFPASHVKSMKISTKRTDMGKAAAILAEVQRRLGWSQGRTSLRGFQIDQEVWSLGTDLINHKGVNAVKFKASLKPPERYLAWFGYQGEEGGSSELAVWLYCGSEKVQNKVALRLNRQRFSAEKLPRDGKYFNVVVKATEHSKNNDCDWFCGVLEIFGLKEKP